MGVNEEVERLQSTALEDCLLFSCVLQIQCELAGNDLLQLMYCKCSGHTHKEENL